MSYRPPSDDAARRAAVDPRSSFLVQAPAGSGKTELLTDRILALLTTVRRPEEIVAITFTRKAASEMQARVLNKLAAGQEERPSEPHKQHSWELAQKVLARDQELDWQLQRYPARLTIRTIDAFCSHLVRAMPCLSALGGMPVIADNAWAHYEAAAQATLELAQDFTSVARLIEHLDVEWGNAVQLLAGMLAARDQWLPLLADSDDWHQLTLNLQHAIQQDLDRLVKHMPPGWARALGPALRHAAQILAQNGKPDLQRVLDDWDGVEFDTDLASVPRWQALARVLINQKGQLRSRLDVRDGFPPDSPYKADVLSWLRSWQGTEAWVSSLARVHRLPSAGYNAAQQDITAVLVEVLLLAAGQLQLRFAQTAEADFIEVARRALQALGTVDQPTDLLLALDSGVRHILLDEFQDTSHTQLALLERMVAGWEPDDGRTLFLVGDPMQSIYRFRKAEVGLFLSVKAHGVGPVALKTLELSDNFRSQATLVHTVNRLCAPIFPPADHPGLGAIRYTPSVPYKEALDTPSVVFHPVWASSDIRTREQHNVDDTVVSIAQTAWQRHEGSPHPVAILVRARSHVGEMVRLLTSKGLPCRAVDLVRLRSRPVVSDLVQLARALAHPADRLAWLSVLRSPLCGLRLHALHALFGRDHERTIPDMLRQWLAQGQLNTQDALDDFEQARLQTVAHILLDESNASGMMPFASWLETSWQRLGGPALYADENDQADAQSLLRLVEELAPYGRLNPAELEASLDELYAAPTHSGPAIEVMTIHKAKGLEFEAVILPGLEKTPPADRSPLIRFEHSEGRLLLGPVKRRVEESADPITDYLAARENERAAYEADRLLYVALTRARTELHLIAEVTPDGSGAAKTPSPRSLLARLWDGLDVPEPPTVEAPSLADQTSGAEAEYRHLIRPSIVPEPTFASQHQAAVQGNESLAVGRLPGFEPAGDERILGTVAHAWLERMARDGLSVWDSPRVADLTAVLRRQLARYGIARQHLDEATEAVRETLVATLNSERGRWLLSVAAAHREWALLDLEGRVSVIDLAISQEEDWLIVDYKTGVPPADESREDYAQRMRALHAAQLARYREQVRALDGRPVQAALYFPRIDLWVEC